MHCRMRMDWITITAWALMAGVTAGCVAAYEWLEARAEQRRRVGRPHQIVRRPRK